MVEIRKKEWAVDLKGKKLCVSVPLWLKLKTVVFNGPPKSRSRAVARPLHPGLVAAWAKQSMLNSTPKSRSRAVARPLHPGLVAAWAKQSMLNSTPKSRSRAVARLVMLAAWASLRSTGLQSLGNVKNVNSEW